MQRIGLVVALTLSLAVAPLAAGGQPPGKIYRIGWLNQGGAPTTGLVAFREGLKEFGYAEGRQYVMEIRFASGRTELLPVLAAELAALPVDVIIANSTPSALAAKQTTRSIPIVAMGVADPVGSGLVQSLARPGGNVTGPALALDEVSNKWLELLMMVRGRLSRVAVVSNSTNQSMPLMLRSLEASARALKLTFDRA